MISRGSDGYYHPANEAEIASLVRQARATGRNLRVRGAGHSQSGAFEAGVSGMSVLLDRMSSVEFDDHSMQVTVQAGCHLGYDPEDPSRASTLDNGLFSQLDRRGWALPDTGGISRQTVSGFLSTGSSGSSVQHAPNEAVVKIRLVDGTGEVHEFERSDDAGAPFFAAGVSMGLLGVITAVTLKCVPRYIVSGNERTSSFEDCAIDLFGGGTPGGRPSLEAFFRQTEHGRLLLWPQKGVRKVLVWQGQKMAVPADFKPKPYKAVRTIFGSSYPVYLAISLSMRLLDSLNPPAPRGWLARRSEGALAQIYRLVAGGLLKASRQEFRDVWWRALPMDDGVNYRLLPTGFTEVWLPLSRTEEAMQKLLRHYDEGGFRATGTYACEIYATPASKFWMSPAYEEDVLKVDWFWLRKNKGDPIQHFYPQLWRLLKDTGSRMHWGKALPGDVEYFRHRYPRWDDFMELRGVLDPAQVFVTDYWRRQLAIPPPT